VHDFTLHPKPIIPVFSDIFLTPNLSWETFGTLYIEIMTDKEIAKRLQKILLWCLKNKKMRNFFSDRHRFFNRQHCCP